MIEVHDLVTECRDPNDNKFLELALSGQGSHIVTGDVDLLVLHPFRGIAIVTPQSFLTIASARRPRAEPGDVAPTSTVTSDRPLRARHDAP